MSRASHLDPHHYVSPHHLATQQIHVVVLILLQIIYFSMLWCWQELDKITYIATARELYLLGINYIQLHTKFSFVLPVFFFSFFPVSMSGLPRTVTAGGCCMFNILYYTPRLSCLFIFYLPRSFRFNHLSFYILKAQSKLQLTTGECISITIHMTKLHNKAKPFPYILLISRQMDK